MEFWQTPIQLHLKPGQIDIWQFDLRSHFPHQDLLLATLNDAERRRLSTRNGFNFGLCRGLLRYLLSQYLSVPPAKITFAYGEGGKPYLNTHPDPGLEFNLSHSGDQMVCAVGRNPHPLPRGDRLPFLGIDVECIRPLRRLEALVKRCLTFQEQYCLMQVPHRDQCHHFMQYWTCKEAYTKAVGKGLSLSLQTIEVDLHPPRFSRLPDATPDSWQIHLWQPTSYSVAALTYPKSPLATIHQKPL